MILTGEYRLRQNRETVWAALNDPAILRLSIPGCEELTRESPTVFVARLMVGIGPVKARFGGRVELSDLDPPHGYTISGEGSGGMAGFAKGGAKVRLAEDDAGGTILNYEANGEIGGKLAQIGQRLIDGAARKLADEFFAAFAAALAEKSDGNSASIPSAETTAPTALDDAANVAPAAPAAKDSPDSRPSASLPTWAWIGGLALLVALSLWVFAGK